MSFRGRLTLFFVLIVIVPMAAVTLVVFRLISDNESGKADAQVAARQEPATRLYQAAVGDAGAAARKVASDERLAAALRAGARTAIDTRAHQLVPTLHIDRLVLLDPQGHTLADVGDPDAIFPATRTLRGGATTIATLEVSVEPAGAYAALVQRVSGEEVVVRRGASTLATTLPAAASATLPAGSGSVNVGGHGYRVTSFSVPGLDGATTVALLSDTRAAATTAANARWLAAGILLGFFVLACGFALAVSRSLQRQIGDFLDAARRLGAGQFDTKVPTVGRDEFAALGDEFNTMAGQLEHRLRQLREERHRVERSMRRLGEAVASNLDRDALLGIVVHTAVEGVDADGGRAIARRTLDGPLDERVQAGDLSGLDGVLRDVELRAMEEAAPAELTQGDRSALAHPLWGGDGGPDVLGVVSVARRGQPFTEADLELFSYLAGQAAVSIENVGLHESVQRQASTDALTGLHTRRRFDEVLAREVERGRRFPEQGLGLVLLDIDDFKSVNDRYGHQIGDEVLRQVARVLRETSREIDAPSRYGGEELAVVLPGTDIEGAFDMAERVRAGIEALALPVDGDSGLVLRVTASLGAAAMPIDGEDPDDLVAAADAALYEAKRAGKNRTVRAGVG